MPSKPLVVIALDPASARRFASIAGQAGWRCGQAPERREDRGLARALRDFRRDAVAALRSEIFVTCRDALRWVRLHARSPWSFDILYLRPEVLVMSEVYPAIAPSSDPMRAFRHRLLCLLDLLLSAYPVVTLEVLCFEPWAAIEALHARLAPEQPAAEIAALPDPGVYAQSMAAVLRLLDDAAFAPRVGMPGFGPGPRYATARGTFGSLALQRGWHAPHEGISWSDGPSASLHVPLRQGFENAALTVRLRGHVAPQPCEIRIFAAGTLIGKVGGVAEGPREATIDVALPSPPPDAPVIRVDFAFAGAAKPAELGLPDQPGRFAFGLKSFSLRTDWRTRVTDLLRNGAARRPAAAGASPRPSPAAVSGGTEEADLERLVGELRRLVGWRLPRRTLAACRGAVFPAPVLSRVLAMAGLGGELTLLHDEEADATAGALPSAACPDLSISWCRKTVPEFFASASDGSAPGLDLVVLSSPELLIETLRALDRLAQQSRANLPDLVVFTKNPDILWPTWWHTRDFYETLISPVTVCIEECSIAFINPIR